MMEAARISKANVDFETLDKIAAGIAATFGSSCETLIMDLDNEENAILSIYNGHVTGRQVGGPVSELGLEAIMTGCKNRDLICFKSQLPNGHNIKSTTLSVCSGSRNLVLIINFDYTNLLLGYEGIADLIQIRLEDKPNTFYRSTNEILDKMIGEAIDYVGNRPERMSKEERIRFMKYLDKRGALLIKKSIQVVAEALGITRCTVYNYLKLIRQDEQGAE